ncbi:MAG: hypothetical protein AB7J28_17215 [Hyphomonadaceae bacterium]
MAQIPGFAGTGKGLLRTYNFGGDANNNAPTLILPNGVQRSYLRVQNVSDTAMRLCLGPATAVASLTNGVITSIAAVNAGFGYTYAPRVQLIGGGEISPMPFAQGSLGLGLGGEDPCSPAGRAGAATAALSTDTVGTITVNEGGSGYLQAPYVYLENDPRDPYGAAAPSATVGFLLAANGGVFTMECSSVTSDAVSIFCASASKRFECTICL